MSAPLTARQLGFDLEIDTLERARGWAHHSEQRATEKFHLLNNNIGNTKLWLQTLGLYLPNLFVALEVGETAQNMQKAVIGSVVALISQADAWPPLSRFIREQAEKDPRRVFNFSVVHLDTRVPPVNFVYQGMTGLGGSRYTGEHALTTFCHHLDFALRCLRFGVPDSLVWLSSTTRLPFPGLLNTPTDPQRLTASMQAHQQEFFLALTDPRHARQSAKFKTLLHNACGGLQEVVLYLTGRKLPSQIQILEPNELLNIWSRCAARGKSGAGACVNLPAGEEMSACGKCHAVRYCGPAHQTHHWEAHKPTCCKQGVAWDN